MAIFPTNNDIPGAHCWPLCYHNGHSQISLGDVSSMLFIHDHILVTGKVFWLFTSALSWKFKALKWLFFLYKLTQFIAVNTPIIFVITLLHSNWM